jgi:AbrB family looped-hinge helix DNA binding protein
LLTPRITTKGQVTIPLAIRQQLGLLPHSEVEFDIVGDTVRIRKKKGTMTRGRRLIEHLRNGHKPMPGMTTDELMALTRGED